RVDVGVGQVGDQTGGAGDDGQRDAHLDAHTAQPGPAEREAAAEVADPAVHVDQAAVPAVDHGGPLQPELAAQVLRVALAVVGHRDGDLVGAVAQPHDRAGRLRVGGDVEQRLPHRPGDLVVGVVGQ